ncbi:MAG TPA: hypothetical protein VLT58_04805 [Polyangia bacterium]|nr:hypothetical protein [Polyangia bacterium]
MLPHAERRLIGWKVDPPPVDGGVPVAVGNLLAAALCRQATLSFPAAVKAMGRHGPFDGSWRVGRDFVWTSTRDPRRAAAGVFEGEPFSWTLQGQVVVLSPPESSPELAESHLHVGTAPGMIEDLQRLGATGLLLPGVDGDVAGLYAFAARDMKALEEELASATREAGGEFVWVDEAAFSQSL